MTLCFPPSFKAAVLTTSHAEIILKKKLGSDAHLKGKEIFLLGFIWFLYIFLFFGFWCAFAVKHGSLLNLPCQKQDLNGKAAVLQGSQSPSGHLSSIWVGVMARSGLGRSVLGDWTSRRTLFYTLCLCWDVAMGAFLWKHPSPCSSWVAVRPQLLLSDPQHGFLWEM